MLRWHPLHPLLWYPHMLPQVYPRPPPPLYATLHLNSLGFNGIFFALPNNNRNISKLTYSKVVRISLPQSHTLRHDISHVRHRCLGGVVSTVQGCKEDFPCLYSYLGPCIVRRPSRLVSFMTPSISCRRNSTICTINSGKC